MADTGLRREPSGWAVGFTLFAGVMMVTIGFFQAFWGLAAILENDFFVVGPNYLYEFDVTAWGWIHLIFGIVVAMAGFGLFSAAVWARTLGVFLAVLSAIGSFLSLPYFPIWAIVIIALDVLVIWALTVHGRDVTRGA